MPWPPTACCLFAATAGTTADRPTFPWPPDSLGLALLYSALFGVLGILLAMLGFKVFDWITPKIDLEEELAKNQNIAVAIVCAAIIIGICLILSRAIGA